MKLIELDPRWITAGEGYGEDGITFLCPHCRQTFLGVWFRVPIVDESHEVFDPKWNGYMSDHRGPYWERVGTSFDGLTLSPSVDASKFGHWHGLIKGGEISNA
jgi:hypothetical protein